LEPLKDGVVSVVSFKLNGQETVTVTGSAVLNDDLREELNAVNVREIPTEFALSQNYPNPFNPTTSIKYSLAENAKVTLVIYDMLGQVVKTLIDNEQEAGFYTVKWDGTNNYGGKVSSGIYIYRLNAGKFMSTLKMNLLK
ncbi:MAG: T9SS type A sorting domain-containing protein, partial [Ignavibacteria bacterium]|nr:T9SS type A sorting domain-containing protein [Ignavibacteria bacterium]